TANIIADFANETEEQVAETNKLDEEAVYETAYNFNYSPRDGTPTAVKKDEAATELKKQRLYRLNDLVNEQSAESMKTYVRQTVKVLGEGETKKDETALSGYTEKNKVVDVTGPASIIGKIADVKITEAKTWSLNGKLVEKMDEVGNA